MRFSNIKCNLPEFELFYFNSVIVNNASMLYYSRIQKEINFALFNHDDCISLYLFYPTDDTFVVIIFYLFII